MNRGRAKGQCAAAGGISDPPVADGRLFAANESVFPQLASSADCQRILPKEWVDCWAGLDHRARMVITEHRFYLVGDRLAEKALASRQDLRLNSRRLEVVDPRGTSELDRLAGIDAGEVRTAFIRRKQRGGHIVMRATPLNVQSSPRLIGIVFWIADEELEVEWPDFGPVFGLTSAEARVVQQLIQGMGAELIATELQVSINTVRTHICHVYEKLGITCREELWRRLAPYRVN